MIRNYFKTAWRNLVKNKTYATINILGLTIGLCACMLMATVVLDDLSYDQQWSRKNDLFRIVTADTARGLEERNASALANLGTELKNNFPEVEAAASVRTWEHLFRLEKDDEQTLEIAVIQADTNVWNMLDIQVMEGNPQQYVAGQGNLVISESFRKKYFPNENPVGKRIYNVSAFQDEATPFLVTGVMADLPGNTYLRAEALQVIRPKTMELNRQGWGFFDEQLILMKPGTDMVAFAEKANRWYRGFLTEASDAQRARLPVYEFQPITDIYLHSDFAFQRVKGNLNNIYIFSGISLLLLTIAGINFVNLSTANAIRRLRETGVRKVLGAARKQLIGQFLTESLLFFALSGLLAAILYVLALGPLEYFVGHAFTFSLLGNGSVILVLLCAIGSLSLLTGLYPAWVLSGSRTVFALKNQLGTKVFQGTWVRKALVVSQFSIAMLVLIGLITVWRQVQYMAGKDLGYEVSSVLSIPQFATGTNSTALKQEIAQIPGVQQVSLAGWTPTVGKGSMATQVTNPQNPAEKIHVNFMTGDTDFTSVLGFKLLEGRFFDERERNSGFKLDKLFYGEEEERQQHRQHASAILTKSTAALFDVTELGHPVSELSVIPVGIIDDFHSMSLHDPIVPTVIMVEETPTYANILLTVQKGHESQVMNAINKLWKQFHPGKPLEIKRVEEMVLAQYEKESKQQQLFLIFSIMILFLSALGVFGLIVQATNQRIKEIGVRKVLGASVSSIVGLFSTDYIKIVLISALIASPIAWWLINQWLEDFSYRTEIQGWMFVLAWLIALAVALLTVSGQAIKAAVSNPVNSLRNE